MKNSQKGFVMPVILAIVALLVIGGGIYIYKKVEAPIVVETETQQTTQTQSNGQGGSQINIPSGSVVVNTKNTLYKHESCGFEISFPSNFVSWDRPLNPYPKQCPNSTPYEQQVDALSLKSKSNCNIDGSGKSPSGCNFFEIAVANNKITGPKVENITVANVSAEKLVILDGGVGQILIQFEKNKVWYRYTHTFSPTDVKEAEKLTSSIISTFKFTK